MTARKPPKPVILSATLILGLVIVIVLLRQTAPLQESVDHTIQSRDTEDAAARSNARNSRIVAATGSQSDIVDTTDTQTSNLPQIKPSPVDPGAAPERENNATIGHVIEDFRKFDKPLAGYKLTNVTRTEEGLSLSPDSGTTAGEASENPVRRGSLESPTLAFANPSNAIQPIWRVKAPEGTGVYIEIALSPDQQNWSHWYPIEPSGDDISPTYPDGRPNPNYGAVSGGIIANGLDLFPYARYRVTLTSGNSQSPVVQEFKLTYLDSTEGLGKIAELSNAAK